MIKHKSIFMNKSSMFFSTNAQKVLAFFLERPSGELYDAQVSEMTGISRAGTNIALRLLYNRGYLKCEKRGRMRFYKLVKDSYLVRQYMVLHTLEKMQGPLEKIKSLSEKAVLFGSQAKGAGNEESDIDILIVTREEDKVRQVINRSGLAEKIRPIIKSPVEIVTFRRNNEELSRSIDEGIILWEGITD